MHFKLKFGASKTVGCENGIRACMYERTGEDIWTQFSPLTSSDTGFPCPASLTFDM